MPVVDLGSTATRSVPRYDYAQQYGNIEELLRNLEHMLLAGQYILTAEVTRFEQSFAQYCDSAFARGVNTGTDALTVALLALGIEKGQEVVTAANTFHATVAAIELAGAQPVLVDAENDSFLLDLDQLSSVLSRKVRCVIPVHLFGKPVDMARLLALVEPHGLLVVEDAAQAHGARTSGRRVGGFGHAGCFSFHPSKNLAAAGDAGAIVTQSQATADRIDLFRSLGQQAQNDHRVVGLNSKLDALQARILSWKLDKLDSWNASRRHIAAEYRAGLAHLPLTFQSETPGEEHVYHLFQIRTSYRDRLLSFLRSRGIDAIVRYPTPIHLQPAFAKWGWRRGQFPVAERLADELLCLPIRPFMTPGEIGYVIETVAAFFEGISSAVA